MDSDDSRDASSGNDSDRDSKSPMSNRSKKSGSRSSSGSPQSGPNSRKIGPNSPQSGQTSPHNGPPSPRSGPPSPRSGPPSTRSGPPSTRSGPPSPRSGPPSPRSGAPFSRNGPPSPSRGPASPKDGPRSPNGPKSPQSGGRSSRSSSSDDDSSYNNRLKTHTSAKHSRNRSPSNGPRSPSPANSSRSSSADSTEARKKPMSPASDGDRKSTKSDSSQSSRASRASGRTNSSRGSRRRNRRTTEDGNSSDSSSSSVDSSSRKNKNITKADTQPEEISDGDMESDKEQEKEVKKEEKEPPRAEINISHEDLSDVSDLDESIGGHSEDSKDKDSVQQNGDDKGFEEKKKLPEKTSRTDEVEEQLDFEAEDGECGEIEEKPSEKEEEKTEKEAAEVEKEDGEEPEDETEKKEPEELEEGEVTDEDDVRPEETEPRPVCRFFSRGQCTWGASCRFLHPGVTDKGNYTMFEMIRPVVPGEFGRDDRMYGKMEPAPVESAWERGLRAAKEMVRKSVKRKEQDIDFEEKKLNLSLAQEEFDKENGYFGARGASPEPRFVRHVQAEFPVRVPPEEYYGRRQVVYDEYGPPVAHRERERERERRPYRELPAHRMPDFFNNKYEEEPVSTSKRLSRPKREVIVQRAAEERPSRADDWSDPWMRSKSPGGRRKEMGGRKRSYSSGSSYSSSSSSRSSSDSSRSSYRSRSRSRNRRGRSYPRKSRRVSPSVIVSERKAANERAAAMNPPAPKRRAPSPSMMRVSAANPPAPAKEDQFGRTNRSKLAAVIARVKGRKRTSRSSSDSSGSSSSDSESSDSSSSSSRDGSPPRRSGDIASIAKAMDALKSDKRQIKLNLKNPVTGPRKELADLARKAEAAQAKKRLANSPPPSESKSKKQTSRREELLKQLKAVEDAIAKKRSKVN